MTKCNDKNEQRRHNTGLAKVAFPSSADTFVVNQSLVLRINNRGEKPPAPSPKPLWEIILIYFGMTFG